MVSVTNIAALGFGHMGNLLFASAAGGHHDLPLIAPPLFKIGAWEVSNSAMVSYIVVGLLILFAQIAMRKSTLVPGKLQNFAEWIVESLQGLLNGILGPKMARETFWFFATIFIFILASNWFALIPGVGTVGWGVPSHSPLATSVTVPVLRGVNADLNMTMAMGLLFFFLWLYWSLKANGIGGFLHHIFGSKAKIPGLLGYIMAVVFFLVGFIEVVSILIRSPALALRLYGNVYGGEVLLEKMSIMSDNPFLAALAMLPFYFLEVLVGLVQALVFCLLTAVFTSLMTNHDQGHEQQPGSH